MIFEKKNWFGQTFELKITQQDIILGFVSTLICLAYVITHHWLTNNIIGIFFCIFAIQNLFLGNFKIGTLLLVALFFYDVFWVFGTDVMVTVAKNIDGPIKLLFPKQPLIESSKDLSLLGLGDIVIPGIFLSLCMRFDFLRTFYKDTKVEDRTFEKVMEKFEKAPKTYFWACMGGYCVGIICTVAVMLITGAGQPALLYLVPGCLGSVFLTAFIKHENDKVWNYDETTEMETILDKTKELAGVKTETSKEK